MYGNGARIGTVEIIIKNATSKEMSKIRKGLIRVRSVFCAAARGTILRGAAGVRDATAPFRGSAPATLVSGCVCPSRRWNSREQKR